ncbi:thiamine ABC transporter substrate-binding protein [Nocardioides panacisoli]|uniref:Thiamine ABC transporter substrate-binding protein n=1 Tax=Nocardioides panacisoli TaxID=627624 RepID=A0ABP7IDZ2_9ACTN
MRSFRALRAIAALAPLVLASACSVVHEKDSAGDPATGASGGTVVLVTHDSFNLPKDLIQQFEDESGYRLEHLPAGDGGELTNKLVLTKDDPLGDVAFGVDNTYGSRAVDAGVFAPYSPELPEGASDYALPGDDQGELTPIDTGAVCVNVDDAWFAQHGLQPPASLDDLTDPAYKGLFVTEGASTSSPGLAFLLATIAQYGDGWQDYWQRLLDNDVKIDKGWEDAFNVDYSYSGGDRPIVVSYDSDPAYTVEDGRTSTSALLDTCFRQVEYAGVLEGAKNPEGAQALVDWLLTPEVQAALPKNMYVFPVDADVPLPESWARFAKQPQQTEQLDPAEIDANRQDWLEQWNDLVTR